MFNIEFAGFHQTKLSSLQAIEQKFLNLPTTSYCFVKLLGQPKAESGMV